MLTLALAISLTTQSQLDRCLNAGDAARGVTLAMAACYGEDYRRADAQLNRIYRKTMSHLPSVRRAVLRRSQRDWIRQRDRACPIATGPGAGTIERLSHPACLTKQTDRRTALLLRYR